MKALPLDASQNTQNQMEEDFYLTPEEEKNLGVHSPLKTIFFLSIGPLISNVAAALHSLIDSIYVAYALGEQGAAVFGAIFIVEFIAFAIGKFLATSLSVRLSYLFGKKNKE